MKNIPRRYFIYKSLTIFTLLNIAIKNKYAQAENNPNLMYAANTVAKNATVNAAPVKDARKGFGLPDIKSSINAITDGEKLQTSNLIFLNKIANEAPDGRRVPIEVNTTLSNVQKMVLLFDKNPNIVAASLDLNSNLQPYLVTSIKMQQSGNVYALIKSNNQWYVAKKTVKVLIGGCS